MLAPKVGKVYQRDNGVSALAVATYDAAADARPRLNGGRDK